MKFGVCLGIEAYDRIRVATECGFDYIEVPFSALTQASDETFDAFRAALAETGIPCEASNGFIPGNLPITGENADPEALRVFVEKGMRRAEQLGIQVVVFGSGAARKLPEGCSFHKGHEQLVEFLRKIAGPIAAAHGIRIAIEPLCYAETNIIHMVKEGVMLAAASGCENVGGLVDLYHMALNSDTTQNIRDVRGHLFHSHIANPALDTPKPRRYPADAAEYDYRGFIEAVRYAGCPRCSVEAGCDDFAADAPKALAALRSL